MPSQPNAGSGDEYLPRVYDALLRKRLSAKGAVLVEGPKWCGKTTTCEPNPGMNHRRDTDHQDTDHQGTRFVPTLQSTMTPNNAEQ